MGSPTDDLTGVVADRYRVERRVGEGGMATVYLAHDMRHDARVALKVLRPELSMHLGGERFAREIRTTAQLQHPNILPVFDSGEVAGTAFFVMPYVEGETLAQRLRREGPLPIEQALSIAAEVSDALSYAHEHGIVHRDVKPSNIMLSHGHALLADFGIARAIGAGGSEGLTEAGFAIGTVAYMSPEQALGGTIDGRSDIYALGCVLYEMLAGVPPFTGPHQAIVARHTGDAIPSLRVVRDSVPETVEHAIVKAMAKTPADRFTDAVAFRDMLRRATTLETAATARPTPGWWTKRMLAAGAVASVLAFSAYGWLVRPVRVDRGLSADRVMMLPLRVSQGYAGRASVGEDVATLIVNALDGAGSLRWVDGVARLDPDVRDSYRAPDVDEARRMARADRSAHFVTGSITPVGAAGVELALRLYGTASGEVVRTVAPGPTADDDLWRVGLRAASELLSALIGGSPDVQAEWRDREPRAIASFLRGEAAFRRVRLDEALESYRDALARDSTFGLAALRGAQVAGWSLRPEEAAVLVERARDLPLPPRYMDLAEGYAAYLAGDADRAVTALRRTVATYPDMADVWMQLGEAYTHLLPESGEPDSLALHALEEARSLDPTASHILLHLIEIRLRRGETGLAAPLLDQFRASEPDTVLATKLDIMDRCVRDGPEAVDWPRLVRRKPFEVVDAAKSLSPGAAQPPCAMAAYRALLAMDTAATDPAADGRRWASLVGLQSLLVAGGRVDEAMREVDAFQERWGYGSTIRLLDATVDEAATPRALAAAQAMRDQDGPYANWSSLYRLWVVGLLEATRGEADEAEAIADEIARRAATAEGGQEGSMEASLRAHVSLARGDSAEALRRFEELVPPVLPGRDLSWNEFAPLGVERLALARLLMARGEHRRALDVADMFDSPAPQIYALFVRASLQLRLEAASRLSNGLLVARYRARLDALGG